ncbi:hypothetical protein ACIBH1_11590 [Nonomuraea sp. NPDC050663]|uniref:hypothetical protein n=1 Tax=Nonomuraea sp. NPDC050663 TaxID=3364370 RepID=UPI0037B59EBB
MVTGLVERGCDRASERDFDGDGRDDIAIGYLGKTGQVRLLSEGRLVRVPTPPGVRMKGYGWSVTMARINDDRCADLLVGSRTLTVDGKEAAGAVHVLYGGGAAPPRKLVSTRPAQDAGFGEAVAVHGDLIAIGAPGEKPGGAVYLFRNGWPIRRITQNTLGVPGTSELGDAFGDRLALGPLDGGGIGLIVGASGEYDDGPGRQDPDEAKESDPGYRPVGAVTVVHDVTAARLTGAKLPQPRHGDGKPCAGFGRSLAHVPGTGVAVFTPECGTLQLYGPDLEPVRTVTSLKPPWDAYLAASPDGRLAAVGTDPNEPAALLLSPRSPAQDRTVTGAHLQSPVEGGVAFSGERLVVALDNLTADVAVIDPATGASELFTTATDVLSAHAVAG